eukprot:scaffold212079_cov36-Prasinocladus_malaysianus.AAC.1
MSTRSDVSNRPSRSSTNTDPNTLRTSTRTRIAAAQLLSAPRLAQLTYSQKSAADRIKFSEARI